MTNDVPVLWICPGCGREFAHRNQWHNCASLPLADCLAGKSETGITLFHAFEAAALSCGPLRIHATPARIAFITLQTFAEARLKISFIEVVLFLPYLTTNARFYKFLHQSTSGIYSLRLKKPSEIDNQVHQWLKEAYNASTQPTQPHRAPAQMAHTETPARSGKLYLIHWHLAEAKEIGTSLRTDGHEVEIHWEPQRTPRWNGHRPDALVILLERLPTYGQRYAESFWKTRKQQNIPIVFAGGQRDKIEPIRNQFPEAIFCNTNELPAVVQQVLNQPGYQHDESTTQAPQL